MEVLIKNEKGDPLACRCKQCGEFTLDCISELCVSCSLKELIKNLYGVKSESQD